MAVLVKKKKIPIFAKVSVFWYLNNSLLKNLSCPHLQISSTLDSAKSIRLSFVLWLCPRWGPLPNAAGSEILSTKGFSVSLNQFSLHFLQCSNRQGITWERVVWMGASFISGQFICEYLHDMVLFAFLLQACSHRDLDTKCLGKKTTPSHRPFHRLNLNIHLFYL